MNTSVSAININWLSRWNMVPGSRCPCEMAVKIFSSSILNYIQWQSAPDKDVDYTELLRLPFEELAMKHCGKPPIIIIAEDKNVPLVNWELNSAQSDNEGRNFTNILDDFHLQQLVTEPTCHSQTISSGLDLVISARPAIKKDGVVGLEFSDHCLLRFCICRQITSSHSHGKKYCFMIKATTLKFVRT